MPLFPDNYAFAQSGIHLSNGLRIGERGNVPLYVSRCIDNVPALMGFGLAAPIDANDTTIRSILSMNATVVLPGVGSFSIPRASDELQWIQIDQEVMKVTQWLGAAAQTSGATVVRGQAGSQAAAHVSGSRICFLYFDGVGTEQPLPIGNPKRMLNCGYLGGTDLGVYLGERDGVPLYGVQNCAGSQVNRSRRIGDTSAKFNEGNNFKYGTLIADFTNPFAITPAGPSIPVHTAVGSCCTDSVNTALGCYRLQGQPMRVSVEVTNVTGCACLASLSFLEGFNAGVCAMGTTSPGIIPGTSNVGVCVNVTSCQVLHTCTYCKDPPTCSDTYVQDWNGACADNSPDTLQTDTTQQIRGMEIELTLTRDRTAVCSASVTITMRTDACTSTPSYPSTCFTLPGTIISETCTPYSLVLEFTQQLADENILCACTQQTDPTQAKFRVTVTEEDYP